MVQPELVQATATTTIEPQLSKSSEIALFGIAELFAGAGGLAQGFLRAAHFDLVALSDIDENAKAVFEANYPDSTYIASDIGDLKPKHIRDAADGRRIAGLLGGPPCQGFSKAGLRNPNDARNFYVDDYIRFVNALSPDFLLMENVPQILFYPQFQTLLDSLKPKYNVCYAILNAALYGVPQTRHRAFVLAYNRRLGVLPRFPTPTHGFVNQEVFSYQRKQLVIGNEEELREEILGADPVVALLPELIRCDNCDPKTLAPFVTVEEAIGDLQGLKSGEETSKYSAQAQTDYQRASRQYSNDSLLNHSVRHHQPSMQQLIKRIPEGGDLQDVNKKYWPKSHYSQAYGRLHRRGLARTITTFFCNPGSGRFLHPVDDRSITVREAARLQGFADDFEFLGTQDQQMQLVGNAVPPSLAHAIAKQILADLIVPID